MHACILRPVEDAAEALAIHPLMMQLRPHMSDPDAFLVRWARQSEQGYRIVGLYDAGDPVALAGYRIQENMVYGKFLYVDDLVTDSARRGSGYGNRLMQHLQEQARASGCCRLVLDTPMSNSLGHRFYFRCGLLATALRFGTPIET
jgi:ribosomal protein S18 acetylase RimI-like enzyme